MDQKLVYAKTPIGDEAVRQRKGVVRRNLRMVLVQINGKISVEELGAKLGLSNDYMVKVLEQTGNYGEIWDRNLGPDTPFKLPRGINAQWTDGGLLYTPPFR